MSHDVKNDVDAERIRNLLGKILEIIVIFALAFPAVAVVRVMGGENHDAAFVVKDDPMMGRVRIRLFPSDVESSPHTDAGNLTLGLDGKHAIIERMIERQID